MNGVIRQFRDFFVSMRLTVVLLVFGMLLVFGATLEVSSTFIILFVCFGAFLERSGAGNYFNNLSVALVGWARGGPAKVATIASALMGTMQFGLGAIAAALVGAFSDGTARPMGALMLLGADAITSLERGGELTVRSLGTIWGLFDQPHLDGFKSWVQNTLPAMAHGVYSFLAFPGWAATGVLGVILAFVFGKKLGPE